MLLDLAVLEGDRRIERGGQRIEGGADDLAVQAQRIDHAADVDRTDDALDGQFLVLHGGFDGVRHVGAVDVPAGDAEAVDAAQPVLPFDAVGNQLQHVAQAADVQRGAVAQRQLARFAEDAQPRLQRVLEHLVGDLVDETLDRERVAEVRHAAKRAARLCRLLRVPVAAIVRHQPRRQLVGAQFGAPQAIFGHAAMSQCRGARDALVPAGELAFAIDNRLERMHATGAVIVVAEILLARPQQAHRCVDGLGQHHRFGDEVVIEPATVTAADARHADVDLIGGEAGQPLHHGPGLLRRLGGHDEAGAILVQSH